eukprot:scaffold17702_cov57-Phaeocystis_antarctica.AAC.4
MSSLLAADKEFAFCQIERGAYGAGRGAGRQRQEAAGDRGARSVQWRARLQIRSRARGGAHPEHAVHVCDAGGVEAQRLVERRRVLPRVGEEGMRCGTTYRLGGRRRRATAVHAACSGGRDCRFGAGHGEERTENIQPMSVTLEVSKLSGWLNANALCRESKGGRAMRGEVQTGRPEVAADRGARSVQERARLQIGRRARGEAHPEHVAHGCDAGGVEAQRLVERRRVLPRVERTTCDAGRGADREAGGGGRPRCTQRAGEGSTADWEKGTGRSAPGTYCSCP